jgi:T5SS/PEP-CTERM-associated repeat protein
MIRRFVSDFAHPCFPIRQASCLRRGSIAATTLVILLAIGPQVVVAALSFSGDVSLNTGIPTGPVMVGRTTVGSLQLDNGTTFASGQTQFGTTPAGIGTGIVTGPRTTWNMTTADVGLAGIGRLEIEQGAVVDTTRMTIGGQPSSHGTVIVDGASSTLQVRGPLIISSLGTTGAVGRLEASNGAIVSAIQSQTTIGRSGRVLLDGGLLRLMGLTNEGLISGSGELQFTSTGTLNQPGRIEVGEDDHLLFSGFGSPIQNTGLIAVDGGQIEFFRQINNVKQGSLFGGEITLRNGIMRVGSQSLDGTQLTNTGLLAAIGGENHFYGRVQVPTGPPLMGGEIAVTNNSVLIFHDDVTLQGGMMTVFAGSKATLLEDLALTTGSLLLADIAGSSIDSEYGEIEVVGNVQLGGSIRAVLSEGFTPEAGDSFKIITALGGVSGELTLDGMPDLPNRLLWDLEVGANQVALNVVQAPPGDYNTDGVVDAGDYIVWRRAVGQSGSGLAADGNSDGVVDSADYDHWRANFGSVVGGAPSSPIGVATSVPEPCTAALLILGAFVVIGRRRRQVPD